MSLLINPSMTVSRLVYMVVAHDIAKKMHTDLRCLAGFKFLKGFSDIYFLTFIKLRIPDADAAKTVIIAYMT